MIGPMQLQDLAVFATVAAERSFSKAAKKLHRTQPAVSQAVRRLEERVGTRLLDRPTNAATLTDAGGILRRAVVRVGARAVAGRPVDGVDDVLDAERQALERAARGCRGRCGGGGGPCFHFRASRRRASPSTR